MSLTLQVRLPEAPQAIKKSERKEISSDLVKYGKKIYQIMINSGINRCVEQTDRDQVMFSPFRHCTTKASRDWVELSIEKVDLIINFIRIDEGALHQTKDPAEIRALKNEIKGFKQILKI